MGITNTAGTLPGILGPQVVGWLTSDHVSHVIATSLPQCSKPCQLVDIKQIRWFLLVCLKCLLQSI